MEERLALVRFNNVGKSSYCFYNNFISFIHFQVGRKIIRGLELGELVSDLKHLSEFNLDTELKKVKRKANRADIELYAYNEAKAEKSLEICKDIVKQYDLEMHLVSCEYTLDASKVIFMYTSETRVDFRELLKELASVFKCRIELRQIGPRDKSKIVGGLGSCGLPLCCSSFLGEFDGVSINMAKNQMLAINIDKISGSCGRLLCCLKYEDDTYTKEKQRFPKIGSKVKYDNKIVKVTGLNVISDLVKIEHDGNISFVSLDEIQILPPREHKHEPRSR